MVRTKKIYCQNVFVSSLKESITLHRLYNYVDTIQSMNGIVCWYNLLCFENNMTKKSNLMILDNSGIAYSRMLLFVLLFLVYCKIEPNFHAFSRFLQHVIYDLISKRSHLNCQRNKMWRHRRQFLRFITINNISTPIFNWKIAAIIFVSVIDYY